ncbi:MAG: type I-E CRISPR-associated protein Cas7/Cse4/CasC, partial [Thermoguttaceae bacterium]|nr:type I-E CRISPR-associated protein Cas7/Cse4/CasC [Thermoguttaceae bacterium]
DISIFGRMVADDHTLMLEGAGMFAHALSTHEAANEIDFFSAVDDTKPTDDAGAGHIGVLEANSACYYRYIGLNVDLLFDDAHLGKVDVEHKKATLKAFLRAVLEAVPKARKNSMFGYSLPEYALGVVRKGQPLSLVNAFETPVTPGKDGGYLKKSVEALEKHRDKLNATYGLEK